MTDLIYLDSETGEQDPYPWAIRPDEDLRPPKNYKDPEKIAAWRTEAAASQVADLRDRSSLEPILGGIVLCVGIAVGDGEIRVLINETGDETGERALLVKLQTGLDRYPKHTLVSWNGAFDWSFIAKRAMRHGLWSLAARMRCPKPWGDSRHIDPGKAFQGPDSGALWRLQLVAQFLGLEVPTDGVDGSRVTESWYADGPAEVVAHCRSDVELLRAVTLRLIAAGWLDLEVPEVDLPVPPPRGSVEDLLAEALRLQVGRRPETICAAWTAAGGAPPDLPAGQTWAPVHGPRTEPGGPPRMAPGREDEVERLPAYVTALRGSPA